LHARSTNFFAAFVLTRGSRRSARIRISVSKFLSKRLQALTSERPFSLFVIILGRERETPRVGVRNKSYRSTLRRTTAGRTNAFTTPLPRARARQSQTSTVRERARQGLRRRSRNRRRRNARRSHGCKGLGFTV
jgi:hypothetical protein